ncbi:MAG: ATP-binding cassette domain-containing protein [Proteobacteria bacterium]|nr:ATP-binding cassette domain-containing protein [Pseudomonadota bacterium]
MSRFFKPERAALFDISFDIHPGEFVYIAGTSGAGKTTLLRLLHAVELPDTGNVLFNGHNIASLKRSAIAVLRRSIGIIFQDFLLIPDLTIGANVSLPLEVAGVSRSVIRRQVDAVLEQVGLSGRREERVEGLSGGEQQRTAIARALVGEPELILADEPTGSLDAYNADFILDLLEKASKRGTTVVLATHDRMLMAARPHRTIALDQGRIIGISSSRARNIPTEKGADMADGLEQTG